MLDEPVGDGGNHCQPSPKPRAKADDNEGNVELPGVSHKGKKNEPDPHDDESRHDHPAGAELVDEHPFDRTQGGPLDPG